MLLVVWQQNVLININLTPLFLDEPIFLITEFPRSVEQSCQSSIYVISYNKCLPICLFIFYTLKVVYSRPNVFKYNQLRGVVLDNSRAALMARRKAIPRCRFAPKSTPLPLRRCVLHGIILLKTITTDVCCRIYLYDFNYFVGPMNWLIFGHLAISGNSG